MRRTSSRTAAFASGCTATTTACRCAWKAPSATTATSSTSATSSARPAKLCEALNERLIVPMQSDVLAIERRRRPGAHDLRGRHALFRSRERLRAAADPPLVGGGTRGLRRRAAEGARFRSSRAAASPCSRSASPKRPPGSALPDRAVTMPAAARARAAAHRCAAACVCAGWPPRLRRLGCSPAVAGRGLSPGHSLRRGAAARGCHAAFQPRSLTPTMWKMQSTAWTRNTAPRHPAADAAERAQLLDLPHPQRRRLM